MCFQHFALTKQQARQQQVQNQKGLKPKFPTVFAIRMIKSAPKIKT